MSSTTKLKKVLSHLQTKGNITSWEAIQRYRATRLSSIIFVLRKMGYPIISIRETNGNTHYVRYWLKQEAHKPAENAHKAARQGEHPPESVNAAKG